MIVYKISYFVLFAEFKLMNNKHLKNVIFQSKCLIL